MLNFRGSLWWDRSEVAQIFLYQMSHIQILCTGELSKLRPISGEQLNVNNPLSEHLILDPIVILNEANLKLLENISSFHDYSSVIPNVELEPLLLLSLYLAKFKNPSTIVDEIIELCSQSKIWNCFNSKDLTLKLSKDSNLEWSGPIVLELERIRTVSLQNMDHSKAQLSLPISYGYLTEYHLLVQEITTLNILVLAGNSDLLGKSWFTPKLLDIIQFYIKNGESVSGMIQLLSTHAELGLSAPFGLVDLLLKINADEKLSSKIIILICSYYTINCTTFDIIQLQKQFPKKLEIQGDRNTRILAKFFESLDTEKLHLLLPSFLKMEIIGGVKEMLQISKIFYYLAESIISNSSSFWTIFKNPLKGLYMLIDLKSVTSNFAQLGVW